MKIIYLLFICFTCTFSTKSGCTTKLNEVSIYPTTNETLTWHIKSEFFDGPDLTYSLSDPTSKQFQIINPIQQNNADISHAAINIKATKAAKIQSNGFWLNTFALLEETNQGYFLYIAEGNDAKTAPNFNQKYQITQNNQTTCYDIDFIDTETYIIDCQRIVNGVNSTSLENVLFVKNKNGQLIEMKEEASLKAYKQRFIGLYSKKNSLEITHQYLFRITPAYSISLDSELAQDSLIEAYLIIDGQPQNTNFVLDSASLAFALGVPSISFTLVDYQIQSNGDIYLLDAFNGIYIINYLPNGEWLVKQQINPQIGQAFAFSINSLIKQDDTLAQVIVVQGYNYFVHIENNEILFIYDLPFTQLDYPSQIGLSQENVIIRKGNLIYLYNIDTDNVELNSKLTINNTDFILLNPFLPDMIIVSSKLSKRYTLSMGYLKYLGNKNAQEKQLITLIATTPSYKKCQVQIIYQILEDNDPLIYQLKDNQTPFPQKVTENNIYSTFTQLTSGPNLQYDQVNKLQESNLNIDIQKRWQLESTIQWPQNVIYADILVLEQQFYQIMQTDDLNLHIWLCDHVKQYDKNITCTKLVDKLQIGVKITKQTFNLWRHELQNIYFMYLDTEYSVTIKFYHQGELKIFKRIVYENNKIKSIFFADNNFFVIRDDNIILAYSTYSHDTDILAIADANSFKSYGYTYEWKPQRLFGNRKLHPNLLFILNEDNIILVDFHTQFTYLQQFAYTKGIEIEITIADDTFFIVYGKTTMADGKIEEYNFSRLNNIFKVKTVQLYWYQIQQPLIIDQSEGNGILYIRAYCIYTKLSHILVIKPNTLQHDTLIEAWSQYEDENAPLIMAVDGNEQMFLYTFCKGQSKFTSLLINPIMIIQPQINQQDYQSNVNVTLQISNFKFPEKQFNTINIKQQIQVFYTQTIIQLDNTKFKDGITIDSNIKNRIYNLGNDWYSGQIAGMQLDCEQCNSNIELLNIVENQNPSIFNSYEVRDLIRYDENYNIFQATKGLIFTNHDNQLVAVYDFDLPSSTYKCYQTQVSQDKIIIYSLCQDRGQYTIYATGCISITGCSPLGEKFQFEQASKIQLIGNEILVVLQTNDKDPQDQDGSIVIYQIKIGLKQWNLEVLDVITLQSLNAKLNKKLEYFRPSDFQVIKQYSNQGNYYYKIMISNSMSEFIFYDFSIIDSSRYNYLFTESYDLTSYLNNQVNQYVLQDTYYLQLKLLEEIQFDDFETMKIKLIIQTNNVAQYGLQITFKKVQSSYSQLNDIELLFVLNRYKDWSSINKIAITDNRIIVPYINNNNIIFGLYDITHNQPNIPYTIIGATYTQTSQQPLNMALFFHLDNRNLFYINQQQGALQSYEIRDQPQISINNQLGDLKNQIITLIVQNDFNVQQVQFKLDVIQVDLHECKTLINNIHIYPSTNEILQWQLNDGIFEGVGLKYSLNENVDFSIVEPLSLMKTNKNKEKFNGIQSIKAQNVQGIWNDKFAVFSITPISNILYFTSTTTFDFNANIIIDPEAPGIVCYDFDYANSQNNEFLIDCQYKTEKRIYWGTINQLKILSTIESPFPINNQRFVTQMKKNNSTYLLRVTPAYSFTQDHSLSKQSLIELFSFEDSKLTQKSSIDNQKLAKLLNKDKVNFVLVDYKLHDGYLYLLDAENGLITLNYLEEIQDWALASVQILQYQNPMAFDIETYFDNKGKSNVHIVILCYNYFIVIENSNVVKIQDLNYYVSTYPQKIQLSQRYVFIQNDIYLYMYHFNDEQVNLVDVQIKQGGILVNKIAQQLIQVDQTDSNQYTFSQGSLQYYNKSYKVREGQLTITASSINNQRCISQIKYSILKSDDSTIYKKTDSTKPLPSILTINNDFDLGDLASGPNMVYDIQNNTIVEIVQSNNIYYTGMTDSDLIFVDSIESKYYHHYFQQKKNKYLVLYDCIIKEGKFDCKNLNQIQLSLGLNQQIFSTWQGSKLYFIVVDELYSLKLYGYTLLNFELLKQFQFEKIEEESILAQTPLEQSFLVLQKNGQLSAYSLQDYKQLIKITGEQLIGFVGTWKPIALFSNPTLQPTLFFVQNEDNIVLINYINNQFILIKTIQYVKESQIYITLSDRTFFIIENQRISEYTYENLFNILKLKDVELFDQEIILPLNARFQRSTGNLLITTKNKKDQTLLSIFKPGQTIHETNYLSQQKIILNDQKLFSVCGDNEMYVNPFIPILQRIHIIQQSPKLQIQADQLNYIEDTKIQLTISNSKEDNNQIDFEQQIKLINTFTNFRSENFTQNVTIDKNNTENNQTSIQEIQSPTKYTHITNSSLEFCVMNKLGDFKLQTFLQLVQKSDQKYKINYGYVYNNKTQTTQYLYLQASTTMLLVTVNDEKINVQKAEYELSDNYDCFRLDNYETQFYSLCNNGVENQLLIINCEKKCQLENSYISQQNAIAILPIHKNIIAVLHTHPQSPQNYNGYITIQHLNLVDDIWESELLLKIDLPFIKHIFGEVKNFNPSSIQGVLYDKQNYKLIITDSLTGLMILDFSIKDEKVNFNSLEQVHLTQWLNENNQYALDSTLYLDTKIIKTEEKDEKLRVNLVLLTSDVSTYQIELLFEQDKPIEKTIKVAFVRYGDWNVLNYLFANENAITIPYYNDDQVTIGIYPIIQNETISSIRGGYSFKLQENELISPLNFLMLENNNYFYNSIPNQQGFSQFKRYLIESLIINEPFEQQNQTIKINYKNDFTDKTGEINLGIIIPDNDNKDAGLGMIWIILIVIGTFIALSLMGYFYYKAQAPEVEDALI